MRAIPPSAQIVSPVTNRAAGEARNTTTSAISSGAAQRRSGVCASISSTTPAIALFRAHRGSVDDAGSARVDADPGRPELDRQRAREGVDGSLRGGVRSPARRSDHAGDRGKVDDRTAPARLHARQHRCNQQQRRPDVDRVHPVDQLRVEVGGIQTARHSRVVDEHVDSPSSSTAISPSHRGASRPRDRRCR